MTEPTSIKDSSREVAELTLSALHGWCGEVAPQPVDEAVLNACITYLVHGSADFSGMHPGLAESFRERADANRAARREAP